MIARPAPDPPPPARVNQVFGARGWLSRVPPDIRSLLIGASRIRVFATGETIVSAGQEGGGPFGLFQGRIGCWGSSKWSGPVLGHVAIPGDWFGQGPVQLGIERSMTFRALEPSTLLYLPAVQMQQMAAENPLLLRHFGRLSETSAQMMVGLASDLLVQHAERRLAIVLVKAARNDLDFDAAAGAPLPLGQAALAELTGLSRAHLNRILRRWAAEGLVETGYNRIQPVARQRLEALAIGPQSAD